MDDGGNKSLSVISSESSLFKKVIYYTLFLYSILLLNISSFYYSVNSNVKSASHYSIETIHTRSFNDIHIAKTSFSVFISLGL